jgi:ribosome maturation protein SDO1
LLHSLGIYGENVKESKSVTAHIDINGERFEVIVDPDLAFAFKVGKKADFNNVLIAEEIFKDARKGERHSIEKLKKAFGTDDVITIAQRIVKEGEVPITTEQRRAMVEEKRKKIVTMIAREAIDPRTGAPHPPQRIEKAMEEARVHIDPFKPAESQFESVVSSLRSFLPMKFEHVRLAVKIPTEFVQRCYQFAKSSGMQQEEWLEDGSLAFIVEIPAGMRPEFFDRINGLTAGKAIIKELK